MAELAGLSANRLLESLRSDPRYPPLLRRLGSGSGDIEGRKLPRQRRNYLLRA